MSELVYGIHPVRSVLNTRPKQIFKVYVLCNTRDLRLKELIHQINKYNIKIQECTRKFLDFKVKGGLHQGIIIEFIRFPCLKEEDLFSFLKKTKINPLILVLDGITDPRNLGACLRTADAAGVNLVIAPKNRAAQINATVRKVSSGSSEYIPFVQVTNLSRTLQLLRRNNIWIVGTVVQSDNIIFDAKLVRPLALVIGSEGFGIRYLTRKNCNELITIPMFRSGVTLNVSVATGVCLFEILRQSLHHK